MQGCFELSQQSIEQLTEDLHKPLLQLQHQHRTTRPADDDDDDDDDDVSNSQLKHFDDALFGFLRQVAAQRVFSPCVEVVRLFPFSPIQHSQQYSTQCRRQSFLSARMPLSTSY